MISLNNNQHNCTSDVYAFIDNGNGASVLDIEAALPEYTERQIEKSIARLIKRNKVIAVNAGTRLMYITNNLPF